MICLFSAACSGGGGGENNGIDAPLPDAKIFMDAPPVVAGQYTLSGKTTERGLGGETAVAQVVIELYSNANESTPMKMTTTNASGEYSMTVMSNGPIDGYIKATKSGYIDIFMYPAKPIDANLTDSNINMITPSNKDFLSSLAGGNQMAGKGLIGLAVVDGQGNPVQGATVSSTPAAGSYHYTDSGGLPSSSATATSADGVAFMFNVPSGAITVSATKSGMTFKSHVVTARADKMTTTGISE